MNPLDALTQRDKETIKHYIQLYAGVSEPAPIEQILSVWNKQKRTLFKGLRRKLRVSIPVEIPRNDTFFMRELKDVYDTYPIWDRQDVRFAKEHLSDLYERVHNDFMYEFIKFIIQQDWEEDEDYFNSSRLFLHSNIKTGYVNTVDTNGYKFKNFTATIKNGMRTMRTIQKVLKGMSFPRMDLFEEWRNRISDLNINQDIKANLVFSIHPIDFMTMSHNNCDWSSCMNWEDGSYSSGTIEMMNSNMAVIAYLESTTPFKIIFDEEDFFIPNKSWRSLFFINKYIMVGGKGYPYINNDLVKVCLTELMNLFSANLGWNYQYKHQLYKDVSNINNNFYLKREDLYRFDRPKNPKVKKHAIYLYTNCMYNDIIEYKDDYYCCRNWVPKTMRFCVSGPATCMCCGEYIEKPQYISSYDTIGSNKICWQCSINRRCDICGEIKYTAAKYIVKSADQYGVQKICSDECLNNTIYFTHFKKFASKDILNDDLVYIVLTRNKRFVEANTNIVSSFYNAFWLNRNNYNTEIFLKMFNIEKIIAVPYFVGGDIQAIMRQYKNNSHPIKIKHGFYFMHPETKCGDGNIVDYIQHKTKWVPAKEVLYESSSSLS